MDNLESSVDNLENWLHHLQSETSLRYRSLKQERDALEQARSNLEPEDLRARLQQDFDTSSNKLLDAKAEVKSFKSAIDELVKTYPNLQDRLDAQQKPTETDASQSSHAPPNIQINRSLYQQLLDGYLGALRTYEGISKIYETHLMELKAIGEKEGISLDEKKNPRGAGRNPDPNVMKRRKAMAKFFQQRGISNVKQASKLIRDPIERKQLYKHLDKRDVKLPESRRHEFGENDPYKNYDSWVGLLETYADHRATNLLIRDVQRHTDWFGLSK